MSNRCPSCEKFVSLEPADPEVENYEVSENGEIEVSVRLVLACAECSEEMKETTFEFSESPDGLMEHIEQHSAANEKFELDVEEPTFEVTDRFETKDRHGKPIKSFRYMKYLYGVDGTADVTCSCGQTFSVALSDEIAASGMDELV